MPTVREEMSRVRREIICLGGEWDITWSLPQLHRELDDLKLKCSSRYVRAPPQSKATIRHFILYLSLDRLTMFERDLLPGLCKIRISTICPTSSRFPISEESKFAFKPGLTIHRENAGFKIFIPLVAGSPCPKNQLKEWKIEFEVLHRFPGAPIYGVVARGWTDPWTLANAKSIDLPAPDLSPPYIDYQGREINPFHLKPIARIDFVEQRTKCIFNIHVWRCVVKGIIFAYRLIRQTKQTKKSNLEKLDRDIRLLNARNAGEKELMQMDLMMRTIGVLNEFLVAGAAGKLAPNTSGGGGGNTWLSSWLPTGVPVAANVPIGAPVSQASPPVDLSKIEQRIDELRNTVESLVEKSSLEKNHHHHRRKDTTPKSVADLISTRRESVSRGSVLTRVVHAHPPDTSATPSRTESMLSTPAERTESVESEEAVQESSALGGQIAGAWTSAMNAFWGDSSTAVPVQKVPSPSKETTKPKKIIEKSVVEEPVVDEVAEEAEQVPKAPPKRLATSPKKVATKPLPPPTTTSPKKKGPPGLMAAKPKPKPKPPQDPAKAKAELILKLKVLEAKRKADVEQREAELASIAKKLPPVDRFKFPGMPGPPPFKPKKAAEPDPASFLPSALKVNDEEGDATDDQGGE